ncbi:MAG TPA: hypothetical protein VLD39_09120, partial [Gammaproteobacteria bacterium]|nr:hypothetical protein [Gammaproteobacteria bacterium]
THVIYFTQRRLMAESETTITCGVSSDDLSSSRVCRQLVSDRGRYALWHVSHDKRMTTVADRLERNRQILELRAVHLEQVHRTSLVRYLRKHEITGHARELTLQEFYGFVDPGRAAAAEHRSYLISASSQLCAHHLLRLSGDEQGLALIRDYQDSYEQFFAMFCDNARAAHQGTSYLLASLLPDARSEAAALRKRILAGDLLPPRPIAVKAGHRRP